MQRPFVVGVHPHQALWVVVPVFIHQLQSVTSLLKISRGISPHMDDHIALHRRRIGWVVVFLRTVHHPHLRCNAVRTLCCGGKAHVAVFLIHQPSPGDLRPAGVNNYQRQVGAEFLFGMYGADGLWRGFSVLVVSPALHPPGQQHRVVQYTYQQDTNTRHRAYNPIFHAAFCSISFSPKPRRSASRC